MQIDEQIFRLLTAVAAGAAIGLERELRVKAAGLRTHILVCLGAALYMIIASHVAQQLSSPGVQPLDPLRVLGGLIGGIGFLAAGVILQQRGAVHGLTTAASLWMTAALGAAAGLGLLTLVATTVAVMLTVLWPVQYVEGMLVSRKRRQRAALREQPPPADLGR